MVRVCAKSLDNLAMSFRDAAFASRNLGSPTGETFRSARSDSLLTLHTPWCYGVARLTYPAQTSKMDKIEL